VSPRCSTHPTQAAGWRCLDCERLLCPDCAARVEVVAADAPEVRSFDCCAWCDGRVSLVYVPGTRATFSSQLLRTLRVPVSGLGLLVGVLVLAGFIATRQLSGGAALAALAVVAPVFWTLFFLVLRSAARASDEVGWRERADLVAHGIRPALAATILSGAAAAAYLALPRLGWLLTVAIGLAAPAWLIALAGGHGLWSALSPVRFGERIRALGRDAPIAALVSTTTASLVFWWVSAGRLASTAVAVDAYRTLDGVEVVLDALSLYALFVVARALGLLLSVRGDALGYGLPDSARVPALPGVIPRGRRRAAPATAPTTRPKSVGRAGEGDR
jgi:hypothetical protein